MRPSWRMRTAILMPASRPDPHRPLCPQEPRHVPLVDQALAFVQGRGLPLHEIVVGGQPGIILEVGAQIGVVVPEDAVPGVDARRGGVRSGQLPAPLQTD